VEAAKVVISEEVAVLWSRLRDCLGLAGFADRAAPQLIRWEARFGWTRTGWDKVRERETSPLPEATGIRHLTWVSLDRPSYSARGSLRGRG
jgi:hypothetical protein